jgi:hypothetical protein
MQVRFHLAYGENYRKWQVKSADGQVMYFDPEQVSLVGCTLHNQRGTATRIFEGANKDVCAWVECANVALAVTGNESGSPVFYDPKVAPFWRDAEGNNIDGKKFNRLFSYGRRLMEVC